MTTGSSTRVSFGGPILRDRLFAYASYMPEFERTQRTIDHQTDGRRIYNIDKDSSLLLDRSRLLAGFPFADVRIVGMVACQAQWIPPPPGSSRSANK